MTEQLTDKTSSRKRRGRGEGGIYQRGDGQWVGAVSLGMNGHGKRNRRVVYGSTKKEVQDELRKLQDQAGNGTLPEAQKLKLALFLTDWLDGLKTKGLLKPT